MDKNFDNQQPIFGIVDEIMSFESSHGIKPFSEEGIRSIMQNPAYKSKYMDKLLSEVSEESERELIGQMINNSTKDLVDPFSLESHVGGFQSGANRQEMYAMSPISILGYTARSHALELFNVISRDDPEFTVKYTFDYVIPSDSTDFADAKILPAAIRDGSIRGMLDGEKVAVVVNGSFPHVKAGGFIATGSQGNFIAETPNKDIRKWTLGGNLRIVKVKVDTSNAGDGSAIVDQSVSLKASQFTGDMSMRIIAGVIKITLADTSVVEEAITVMINRDTGEYTCTPGVRISEFLPDMDLVNAANELAPVTVGRKEHVAQFFVTERKPMSIPLTQGGLLDDFSEAGKKTGVAGYIKKMTDIITDGFAGINDNDLEYLVKSKLDECIADGSRLSEFPLHPKLGGFAALENYDVADRGPGGDSPSSWLEYGLKDLVSTLLADAEAETEFRRDTNRSWVMLGYSRDIERFVDKEYKSAVGAVTPTRNGFSLNDTLFMSDNFGRRTSMIGTRDKRHKNWNGEVIAVMKSFDMKQPTNVYFGYDFKVSKGIDPTLRNIPSIMFNARDYKEVMSQVGFKIKLTNPRNLVQAISAKVNA